MVNQMLLQLFGHLQKYRAVLFPGGNFAPLRERERLPTVVPLSAFGVPPYTASRSREGAEPGYVRMRLYALNVMTSPQTSSTPSKTMNTVEGVFAEPR